MVIKFRTKYDRVKVKSPCGRKSLTDQQYKDECSIEGIVKKYGILGQPIPRPFGSGADVSEFQDFAANMQKVTEARNRFMDLPSDIRARFGHSPEAFFSWLSNPEHTEEAVKLGLMEEFKPQIDIGETLERIAANTAPKVAASEV